MCSVPCVWGGDHCVGAAGESQLGRGPRPDSREHRAPSGGSHYFTGTDGAGAVTGVIWGQGGWGRPGG